MSGLVFVDANVLIYANDPAEPVKGSQAREWLARLWTDRSGRTSMQALNEFYVNAVHKIRPGMSAESAWEEVTRYLVWNPAPIDVPLMRRAHEVQRRYQISWWDSMIVAAALAQDCVILLTEDLQDGMVFGTLAVRSPFSAVLEQPAAGYVVPRAAPLHRARGRPRR